MVSQDRFAVYRATVSDVGEEDIDRSQFSTGTRSHTPRYRTECSGFTATLCRCFRAGDRNIHLDMNPWWWMESSEDILRGVETLQYTVFSLAPGDAENNRCTQTGGDSTISSPGDKPSKANMEADHRKKEKKSKKKDAAGTDNQDFIRENNHVVQCMGRFVVVLVRVGQWSVDSIIFDLCAAGMYSAFSIFFRTAKKTAAR
jgi:hypothetical protein